MKVQLTSYEFQVAKFVGEIRQNEALAKGLKDKHGLDPKNGVNVHVLGSAGEMAFCKAFNIYWPCTVNVFKSIGDVGAGVEIRTRSKPWYDLLVRQNDFDDRVFVHITGDDEDDLTFHVKGWLCGKEAKRRLFMKDHGGREPAYFVNEDCLHSIEEFPKELLINA